MPCTVERQITVALENQPGQLAAICRILTEWGVNICALSVIDNIEHGVVRIVAQDAARCREALASGGFYHVEAEVLALNLMGHPDRIAEACETLGTARINIAYAYSSHSRERGGCEFILKVSDTEVGQRLLDALSVN